MARSEEFPGRRRGGATAAAWKRANRSAGKDQRRGALWSYPKRSLAA